MHTDGERGAREHLAISREALARVLASMPVTRGTLAWLRERLEALGRPHP
jgi:hypothetical protein